MTAFGRSRPSHVIVGALLAAEGLVMLTMSNDLSLRLAVAKSLPAWLIFANVRRT